MAGHCLLADEQRRGGLLIGGPGGNLIEDVELPIRQPARPIDRPTRKAQSSIRPLQPHVAECRLGRLKFEHGGIGIAEQPVGLPNQDPHRGGIVGCPHRGIGEQGGPQDIKRCLWFALRQQDCPAEMISPSDKPGARESWWRCSPAPHWLAQPNPRHCRPRRSRRTPATDGRAGTCPADHRRGMCAPSQPHRRAGPPRVGAAQRQVGDRARAPGPVGTPARHRPGRPSAWRLGQLIVRLAYYHDVEIGKLFGGDRRLSLSLCPLALEAEELDTMHPANARRT